MSPATQPGDDAIINGNTVSADTIGSPYLTMSNPLLTGHCTGTLIRSDWLLTAHHCVTQNAQTTGGTAIQPSEINAHVLNGGNTPSGRLIIRHPTLDAALVKLTAPATAPSLATYPNWFALASEGSMVSQSFWTQGWGANAITSCAVPPGSTGAGVLRSATVAVSSLDSSDQYKSLPNSSGQIAFSGDSGSSMYQQVRGYFRPIGVASWVSCTNSPPAVTDVHYVRTDAIRGWAQGVAGFWPAQGQTIGYERSDGVTAFNYVEPTSGHVKEVAHSGGSAYTLGDLSAAAGVPVVSHGSQIASYVRTDGVNAVVLLGGDSNVWELALTSGWGGFNMTGSLGLPLSAGGAPTAYVRSDNASAVVYVGSNQHVYEMRLPSGGSSWVATDLSAAAGFPVSPVLTATGYVRADGLDAVVYAGTNSHIIELSRNGSQWSSTDLTAGTGAPLAAGVPRPYTRADGYSAVVYRTTGSHVQEIFLAAGGAAWGIADLTAASGCVNDSSEPAPFVRIDNTNEVLFLASNQHVYELGLAPGAGWACHDLTSISGAPTATTVPNGFVGADRVNYITFSASTGHIWRLDNNAATPSAWGKQDLTALVGGP
ncbi:MAG TPA: trypsin-like serine protease [Polyangia bacterium]|nr:trypsin-like serine protease [Polyangia bacterium]